MELSSKREWFLQLKALLVFFMIIGIAIALYGAWEIMETVSFVNASPDAPEDEFPLFAYDLAKGDDEFARALIEGGMNLHKGHPFNDRRRTVGGMAVVACKPELVELIRQRGGTFTQ